MPRPSPQTDRVVALVELLASQPDSSLTLAEATRRLEINKSTCYSMLSRLTAAGWLLRDPFRKTYRLGPGLVAVGQTAAAGFPALAFARPAMVDLSVELQVHCAALGVADDHVTVLDQIRDVRAAGAGFLHVGATIPLRAPFGSAVLAWAPADALERWLAEVPAEGHARHRAALDATRTRGYAVEIATTPEARLREMLAELGDDLPDLVEQLAGELAEREDFLVTELDPRRDYRVSTINAPVFDYDGGVTLVLCLTGFGHRLSGAEVDARGRRLADATAALSSALRGTSPDAGERTA